MIVAIFSYAYWSIFSAIPINIYFLTMKKKIYFISFCFIPSLFSFSRRFTPCFILPSFHPFVSFLRHFIPFVSFSRRFTPFFHSSVVSSPLFHSPPFHSLCFIPFASPPCFILPSFHSLCFILPPFHSLCLLFRLFSLFYFPLYRFPEARE